MLAALVIYNFAPNAVVFGSHIPIKEGYNQPKSFLRHAAMVHSTLGL